MLTGSADLIAGLSSHDAKVVEEACSIIADFLCSSKYADLAPARDALFAAGGDVLLVSALTGEHAAVPSVARAASFAIVRASAYNQARSVLLKDAGAIPALIAAATAIDDENLHLPLQALANIICFASTSDSGKFNPLHAEFLIGGGVDLLVDCFARGRISPKYSVMAVSMILCHVLATTEVAAAVRDAGGVDLVTSFVAKTPSALDWGFQNDRILGLLSANKSHPS